MTPEQHAQRKSNAPHATEIRRNGGLNGWYWIVRSGNRLVYHGPYRDQATAEAYREDVDTYRHDREVGR